MALARLESEVQSQAFDVRHLIGESILPHMDEWEYLERLRQKVYDQVDRPLMWQLRLADHDRCGVEVAEAEAANRPVTQEEMLMGQRKEWLEPGVRDAVLDLLGKGYTTIYSGHDEAGGGSQKILFYTRERLPDEARKAVWKLTDDTGILTLDNGSGLLQARDKGYRDYAREEEVYLWDVMFIHPSRTLEEIKAHWDTVAARMPNLGWKGIPHMTEHAKEFRRTHRLVEGKPVEK